MSISAQTQAILLLTAYFSKYSRDVPKPLTTKEWARFAEWLKDHEINPEQLLNGQLNASLHGWSDKYVTAERIEKLMGRGSALALAMEKWMRAGLWVLTRSDKNYPTRLKQLLKTDSPAVLFGCGNPELLNKGGIAVVGARDANNSDLEFSRTLGKKAAVQGYSVVSGGARGVDETSMLGALEAEGTVIGVMADSLLKAATSKKYRQYLLNRNLVLVSPYYPEAGFNAGNAMSRNKYIYCLSDAAVVVQSGTKGGTWNGAIENLKKHWVSLWVKESKDTYSGNALIISKGGMPLSKDVSQLEINQLLNVQDNFRSNILTQDIFAQSTIREDSEKFESKEVVISEENKQELKQSLEELSFYELFLLKLEVLISDKEKTTEYLLDNLKLNKTQLDAWLKQAIMDNRVKKLNRPVRYQWLDNKSQFGMFDDYKINFNK